jgi:hypothetical protein
MKELGVGRIIGPNAPAHSRPSSSSASSWSATGSPTGGRRHPGPTHLDARRVEVVPGDGLGHDQRERNPGLRNNSQVERSSISWCARGVRSRLRRGVRPLGRVVSVLYHEEGKTRKLLTRCLLAATAVVVPAGAQAAHVHST